MATRTRPCKWNHPLERSYHNGKQWRCRDCVKLKVYHYEKTAKGKATLSRYRKSELGSFKQRVLKRRTRRGLPTTAKMIDLYLDKGWIDEVEWFALTKEYLR